MRQRILDSIRRNSRDVCWRIEQDLRQLAPQISGRLLDLGCGSKPYQGLFPHVTFYVGVDLPVALSANKMEKRADVYADLARLPLEAESFDAVLCTQVLEHAADPAAVLEEAARVLHENGILVLTIPFVAAEHEEPHDYLRFTQFGIRALLERCGFGACETRKQFGFWSTIGEMIYWHYHRKVSGTRWEKYWYAVGTTLLMRSFHLLGRLDRDDKLALNLCVTARKQPRRKRASVPQEEAVSVAGAN